MTGVESINEEAVEAAAEAIEVALRPYPITRNAFDGRLGWGASVEELAAAALAAALPLLRLSDVPGLERQLRDKIAGELREYRAGIIRDDEIPADPRERDPYDRGYCSGLEHAAQWVNRGSAVSS